MENWLDYVIYFVAGISILLAIGGLRGFADTKDRGLLFSSIVSIGFSAAAIIYTHWAPIVVGFLLNIAISKLYPKYAHSLLPPLDSEKTHETPRQSVPDESEFDAYVERQLQGAVPPTKMMRIRPSEYLPDLKADILVSRDLLLDRMTFNREQTLGGHFFDRVAREVLYRWFSMEPQQRADDSHLFVPDHLSSALSMHLSGIFHHSNLHVYCRHCDQWYDRVIDLATRGSSSQTHAAGEERYACPKRHVVYEKRYHYRFVR